MNSAQNLNSNQPNPNQAPQGNIIEQTKKIVAEKSQLQRFKIAKKYLFNALDYKTPRLDVLSKNSPGSLRFAYDLQTNYLWREFLSYLAYIFMYAAFFGHNHPSYTLIGIQFGILFFFVLDLALEIYHKYFSHLPKRSKFLFRFYLRTLSILLLVIDTIIAVSRPDLPVRPFLILRCFLTVIYDPQIRKMFYAIMSTYIDILVYLIFYMIIIILFSIMVNQFVQFRYDTKYDDFVGNYKELGKAIFLIYVLTSFDAYPDNQLVAIRLNLWIYAFFIAFIFLNALIFVAIPTNILLQSVKKTRAKTTMVDQIQQQHNLIMVFIALGGDKCQSIAYEKVVRFLLFVFNNEVKYLDKITQICRNLDQKVNGTIQVSQIMQLCKIIQSKSYLRPPRHQLWRRLSPFQSFLDNKLKLKKIVRSNQFQLFFALFALFAFINCILTMYVNSLVFDIIDDIIMVIILAENAIKLIALGPQIYFGSYLNIIDLIIALVGLFFQIAPREYTPKNAAVFAKMFRIFRVTLLIRYITKCFQIQYKSTVYQRLTLLINQLALLFPIIFKFFPIYMIVFYFLGVLGVQIFWYQTQISPSDSPYSNYNQFSNFFSLLGAQFIYVQVFTEAGWSLIAYDHAYRYGNFALTMLFFVVTHQIIVIIISSLFKGIIWQAYAAISQQQQQYREKIESANQQQAFLNKRLQKFKEIKDMMQRQQLLMPDNIMLRQIYQKKIDIEILNKILGLIVHKSHVSMTNEQRKIFASNVKSLTLKLSKNSESKNNYALTNSVQSLNQLMVMGKVHTHASKQAPKLQYNLESQKPFKSTLSVDKQNEQQQKTSTQSSIEIQKLKQQDIQKQIDDILNEFDLHSGIKFSFKILNPPTFINYIRHKIRPIKIRRFSKSQFNTDKDIFGDPESSNFLVHGIHTLLNVQTSQREHRSMILRTMVERGLLAEDKATKMLTEKSQYEQQTLFDYNWIVRKIFLSGTKEQVIRQFQIEYFSSMYGKSFKQINKTTIFPLMKLQARICYSFSNILRYKQIGTYQFFHTLLVMQNKISSSLLKEGSVGKFIYQIDGEIQSWFTIQLKDSNELRIHFIKNGVWIYHKGLNKDQVYVGKDIFNWVPQNKMENINYQKYIKRFFQTFESLALCMENYDQFFRPQPQMQIYDIFSLFRDVQDLKRYKKHELSISKIMFVALSKQTERQNPLPYSLSDIKYDKQQIQELRNLRKKDHYLNQTQSSTFAKLQQLQKQQDSISKLEGLPYSYIINFLIQIRETMSLHEVNFVYHVEKLLNQHFQQNQKVVSKRLKLEPKKVI